MMDNLKETFKKRAEHIKNRIKDRNEAEGIKIYDEDNIDMVIVAAYYLGMTETTEQIMEAHSSIIKEGE